MFDDGRPMPRGTNGLGIAGFITSLVGLVGTCGLLSPVGMVMSFIAMFREPRGLAIAGFVIGLAGSIWIFIAAFFIGLSVVAGVVAGALGLSKNAYGELALDAIRINVALQSHMARSDAVPPTADGVSGLAPEAQIDKWGRLYRIEWRPIGSGYAVVSDGEDGLPGTPDDIRLDFDEDPRDPARHGGADQPAPAPEPAAEPEEAEETGPPETTGGAAPTPGP